jgi:hypothetical protein
MIKFLRKIRQKMLVENKFSKYLLYAIGEIILVVIGILIALSINNWNENRKKITVEIHVLKDIKSDLQENIINLEEGIIQLGASKTNTLKVISMYEHKTPYHDSLLPTFSNFIGMWDPDFTYAGFENLKCLGVNLITNVHFRKEIIILLEIEMDILDTSDMSRFDQINITMLLPMIKKYFHRNLKSKGEHLPYMPSNYVAMINDPEFYNVCTELAYRQQRSSIRFAKFNEKAKELITKIESEIKALE